MPTLEELRSRHVVTGVPSPDDLIPYIDVDEVGNSIVKKTLVSNIGGGVSGAGAGITDAEAFRGAIGGLSYLNVKDYGATGDGVTNDTAAVEACFDAGVASGVKSFYFPPGTYVLTDLACPGGCHIFGASPAGATAWEAGISPAHPTRFVTSDATSDVLRFLRSDGAIVENVEIEHVSASVTSAGYGIRLEASTPGTWPGAPFRLLKCTIRNFARGLFNNSGNRIHIDGSHLVQCDYGYYSTGVTSTLSCINSELGGIPKDGGNGQSWYLSNAQGAFFGGCEFGNCYRVGNIEGSSVVEMTGCNFETVSGPYAIGITTGRLVLTGSSCAAVAAPFVRNTGTAANIVSFDGFTIRSGGTVIFDGRAVGYETSVDGDFPTCINTQIACRRTTGDFATVREYWSGDRNPLPFGAVPEIQRLELSAATASASTVGGGVNVSTRGMSVRSATGAGSLAVSNLSKGDVYSPVLMRRADSSISTFDWGRRMVIRFKLHRFDQGSGSTSDNEAAVLFGVPYNRTTTGPLATKGFGIQISNTSVTAVVHNGSTGASVALGSITDATRKEVVLDYDGAGTLKASLTGHYDVTRTGGPTGVSGAHENSALVAAWNTTGGTSIPHYGISDLEIAYY